MFVNESKMDVYSKKEPVERRAFLKAVGGLAAVVCSGSIRAQTAASAKREESEDKSYCKIGDDSPYGSTFLPVYSS